MLGFVHILEICFHPTNVWHESWDKIENFGFYTHPINMFDDQSPICLKSICSGVQSIEHPNVLREKINFTAHGSAN